MPIKYKSNIILHIDINYQDTNKFTNLKLKLILVMDCIYLY